MTALVPVFFLEGLSGAFFRPLAQAYIVATLVSPFIALTVTPALVLILLSNAPIRERISPLIPPLHRSYTAVLSRSLNKPMLAYTTTVVLLIAGIIVWPLLGTELLPTFKERRHSEGWAHLMNVSVMEYAFLRTFDSAEAKKYRTPIEKLLRRAGVEPWAEMRVKGKRPPRVEMTYWQKDDRVIVCIVRNPLVLAKGSLVGPEPDSFGETLKLTVIFDEIKEDVINERTGAKLGNGSEFQISWATNEAAMLSFRR